MAQGADPDKKMSWAHPIGTRDGTLTQDSKMVNAFLELAEDGNTAVKRPGVSQFSNFSSTGTAQGQFLCSSVPFAIVSDVIFNTTLGTTTAIPGVTTGGLQYDSISDVPQGTSIIKSTAGMWIVTYDGTTVTVTKVTDANYPPIATRGLTYLDGVFYVMNQVGEVLGSALEDPTTWPALNFIRADLSLGQGAGIVRHLNYIVAFYQKGTQVYYDADASIPTAGTPLGPVGNASWTTGCSSDASIFELTDITFFLSRDRVKGTTVQELNGLQLGQISTIYVEKILNRSTLAGVYTFGVRTAGHSFYVIALPDLKVSLYYDLVGQQWGLWTSLVGGVEQQFRGGNYQSYNGQDYLQDMLTGQVLWMREEYVNDSGALIPVTLITPPVDWGTMSLKRFSSAYLMADTVNTTVFISYSDDDYVTWSVPRAVDMSTVRKMLNRLGAGRRRAWKLTNSDNTNLRIYSTLFDASVGPG